MLVNGVCVQIETKGTDICRVLLIVIGPYRSHSYLPKVDLYFRERKNIINKSKFDCFQDSNGSDSIFLETQWREFVIEGVSRYHRLKHVLMYHDLNIFEIVHV